MMPYRKNHPSGSIYSGLFFLYRAVKPLHKPTQPILSLRGAGNKSEDLVDDGHTFGQMRGIDAQACRQVKQ